MLNPLGDGVDGVGVHHIAGEGRHLQVSGPVDAREQNGFREIARFDDAIVGETKGIRERAVDEALRRERDAEARVEITGHAIGAMALGAIGVEIGAHAKLGWIIGVIDANEFGNVRDGGFVLIGAEQTNVIPSAQLIVRDARSGISQRAVELSRVDAEDAAGIRIVADETIEWAGIIPRLCAHTGSIGDSQCFG